MNGAVLRDLEKQIFLDMVEFVSTQPEAWRQPSGELLAGEKEIRLNFAQRYCAPQVITWLGELGLEALVSNQFAHYGRQEFINLIAGKWITEAENERN